MFQYTYSLCIFFLFMFNVWNYLFSSTALITSSILSSSVSPFLLFDLTWISTSSNQSFSPYHLSVSFTFIGLLHEHINCLLHDAMSHYHCLGHDNQQQLMMMMLTSFPFPCLLFYPFTPISLSLSLSPSSPVWMLAENSYQQHQITIFPLASNFRIPHHLNWMLTISMCPPIHQQPPTPPPPTQSLLITFTFWTI